MCTVELEDGIAVALWRCRGRHWDGCSAGKVSFVWLYSAVEAWGWHSEDCRDHVIVVVVVVHVVVFIKVTFLNLGCYYTA